jgi:hypothetical protein
MSLDMDVESDNDDDDEEDDNQGQWSAEEVGPEEEGEADDTGEMDGQNAGSEGEESQGPTATIEEENERKTAENEDGEPLPTVPVPSSAELEPEPQRRHSGTLPPDDLVVVDPVICAAEEREIPAAPVSESEVGLLPTSAETIVSQDKSAGNAQAESETGKRIVNNDMPAEELPPPALTSSVKSPATSEVATMQEKGDTIHEDKDNPIAVPVVRDDSGVGIGDIATPAAPVASPPLPTAAKTLQTETNLISERTSQEKKEEIVKNIPAPVREKSLPDVSLLDKTPARPEATSEDLNKNKDNKQQEGKDFSTQHQRRWPLSGRQQQPSVPPADQQKQPQELQQLLQKQQPQQLAKIPVECQPAPPSRHKLPAALPTHKLPAALPPTEAAAGVGMVGRVVGTNGTSSAAVTSCKICGRQYTARRDFYRNRNITSFLGIPLHVKSFFYENLNFMASRK